MSDFKNAAKPVFYSSHTRLSVKHDWLCLVISRLSPPLLPCVFPSLGVLLTQVPFLRQRLALFVLFISPPKFVNKSYCL